MEDLGPVLCGARALTGILQHETVGSARLGRRHPEPRPRHHATQMSFVEAITQSAEGLVFGKPLADSVEPQSASAPCPCVQNLRS